MKNAEVLNDLIEINNDRIAGYEKAASQAKDPDLNNLFTSMANQSKELVADLRSKTRIEGEEPAKGTTVKGKIYRTWMDVKSSFAGDDRKSLLASCEFGEDAAQKAYESALEENDITGDVRTTLQKQRAELRTSHDKIKSLRDMQPA